MKQVEREMVRLVEAQECLAALQQESRRTMVERLRARVRRHEREIERLRGRERA